MFDLGRVAGELLAARPQPSAAFDRLHRRQSDDPAREEERLEEAVDDAETRDVITRTLQQGGWAVAVARFRNVPGVAATFTEKWRLMLSLPAMPNGPAQMSVSRLIAGSEVVAPVVVPAV